MSKSDVNVPVEETAIFQASRRLAHAITAGGIPGTDAAGVTVGSLTEAIMGMTSGLCQIADAIRSVSEELGSLDDMARAMDRVADEIQAYRIKETD